MGFNPTTDVVLDVLNAADPARAESGGRAAAGPRFRRAGERFHGQPRQGGGAAAAAKAPQPPGLANARQAFADATLASNPEAKAKVELEAMTLNSFVGEMLPKDSPALFGQGTAGEIWRSMLSEQISRQIAKSGELGLSRRLFATHGLATAERTLRGDAGGSRGRNERQRPVGAGRRRHRQRRDPHRRAEAHVSQRPPRSHPHAAAALPVVERLTRTVTAETEDIVAGRPAPYELYGQRKNQGLIELQPSSAGLRKSRRRGGPRPGAGGAQYGARSQQARARHAAQGRDGGRRHHRPRHPRRTVGRHLYRTGLAPERGMIRSLFVAVVALAAAVAGSIGARQAVVFNENRAAAATVRTTEFAQDP